MKQNTLSIKDYIFELSLWTLVAYVWYNTLLFVNLKGKTVLESHGILIAIILIIYVTNMFVTFKWEKNYFSILTSLVIPFGIYTFIAYNWWMTFCYKIIICIALGIGCLFVGMIVVSKVGGRTKKKRIRTKLRLTYLGVRVISAVISVCLMVCLGVRLLVGGKALGHSEQMSTHCEEECTIANNIETVLLLRDEEWIKLSLENRLEVLKCICDIERHYLGITEEIPVYASILEEHVLGCFSVSSNAIYISENVLKEDDASHALAVLTHEAFHAAEWEYVQIYRRLDDNAKNNYFFYSASLYSDEFSNYIKSKESYTDYFEQTLERDARSYSKRAVAEYYQRINDYICENE